MLWATNRFFLLTLFILLTARLAQAAPSDNTLVFIECTLLGQPVSKGTGSIVSEDGHVLTAKHVVPDGTECLGSIGSGGIRPNRRLIPVPKAVAVDAALLRFVRVSEEKFSFLKACSLNDSHKLMQIVASGFPDGGTGEVSSRRGVISTTQADGSGVIETDGLTAPGMSGGPVTFLDGSEVVGIIAGARFSDTTATPIAFGVLTFDALPSDFNLKSSGICGKKLDPFRVVYFKKNEDHGRVERLLQDASIQFELNAGRNSRPTNFIYCTPDAPLDLVRRIGLALHDGNVPIYGIERATYGLGRITVESVDIVGRVPMKRDEIAEINACAEPPIKVTNICDRRIRVYIGYFGSTGLLRIRVLPVDPGKSKAIYNEWQGGSLRTRDNQLLFYAETDPDMNGQIISWPGDLPYALPDGREVRFRSAAANSFRIRCRQ